MKRHLISMVICCSFLLLSNYVHAQDQGTFSGSLELNSNYFLRDSAIGAANIPQYDNELSGGEVWLNLNYNYKGFDFGMRFDAFLNSNLRNPNESYTAQGIGYWHIRKKVDKLDITAGHFYDQIGSGIIFRSYESRPLFIDNAMIGVRLNYDLIDKENSSLLVKGFMGRQRRSFLSNSDQIVSQAYRPYVKGLALDGFWSKEDGGITLAPGAGVVNRTLDETQMTNIVAELNRTYDSLTIFTPKYNNYAFTVYNTLTAGNFSWYVEGAYKTQETINKNNVSSSQGGDIAGDTRTFINRSGTVLYSSLSYSQKGFGITIDAKRTEFFSMRLSPFFDGSELNAFVMNFIPPVARQNTYRLTARYNPAIQELGELAFQGDLRYSPKKRLTFNLFGSYINDLEGKKLFREAHINARYRKPKKYSVVGGFQYLQYNQKVYINQTNGGDIVTAYVPYVDFLYKFDRKKSLRTELQYMHSEEDFGSWVFALMEFSFAPHWIITVSDMYNIDPISEAPGRHYPTGGVVYNYKSSRFGLSFVKQVEGVVCSGGVCRLEPGFSGVRFNLTTTF